MKAKALLKRSPKADGSQEGSDGVSTFVIRPPRGLRGPNLRELKEYRELFYFLTLRDIKIRYKQTVLGVAWAVLQPAALMVVFSLFFGQLAKMPSEGLPYPLFIYAALLPWQLFSRSISESANSLVADQRVITRVYFPRLLIPTAMVLATLLDVAVGSLLLIGMMAYYGIAPSLNMVWLPGFVLLMVITGMGIGFWLSALNIEFRDVRFMLPFFTHMLLFLTPVVYPSSLVPERFQMLYGLNPMVGVIEGFRWSLLDAGPGVSPMLIVSAAMSLLVFVSGMYFFRWRERVFIDVVGSGGR